MDLMGGVNKDNTKFTRVTPRRKALPKRPVKVAFIDEKTRKLITAKRYFTAGIIEDTAQKFNDSILDFFFSKFPVTKQLFKNQKVEEIVTSNRHIELGFSSGLTIGIYLKSDLSRKIIVFDTDYNKLEERVINYSIEETDDLYQLLS